VADASVGDGVDGGVGCHAGEGVEQKCPEGPRRWLEHQAGGMSTAMMLSILVRRQFVRLSCGGDGDELARKGHGSYNEVVRRAV